MRFNTFNRSSLKQGAKNVFRKNSSERGAHSHVALGRKAETQVAEVLEEQGFRILKRNWQTSFGEVDLVATREAEILIVEVKLRSEGQMKWRPLLSFRQKKRLEKAALWIWQKERLRYSKFVCKLAVVTERGVRWLTLPLLYDRG